MTLLDKLEQGPTRKPRVCKYVVVRSAMDKKLGAKVDEILSKIASGTGEYNTTWLARTLREDGIIINHATLNRHTFKECCCHAH
jgi:hypothetical protein